MPNYEPIDHIPINNNERLIIKGQIITKKLAPNTELPGIKKDYILDFTDIISGTYQDIKFLYLTNQLIPNKRYEITNFRTVHFVPNRGTIRNIDKRGADLPEHSIILKAAATNAFSPYIVDTEYPNDLVKYDITGAAGGNQYPNDVDSRGWIYSREWFSLGGQGVNKIEGFDCRAVVVGIGKCDLSVTGADIDTECMIRPTWNYIFEATNGTGINRTELSSADYDATTNPNGVKYYFMFMDSRQLLDLRDVNIQTWIVAIPNFWFSTHVKQLYTFTFSKFGGSTIIVNVGGNNPNKYDLLNEVSITGTGGVEILSWGKLLPSPVNGAWQIYSLGGGNSGWHIDSPYWVWMRTIKHRIEVLDVKSCRIFIHNTATQIDALSQVYTQSIINSLGLINLTFLMMDAGKVKCSVPSWHRSFCLYNAKIRLITDSNLYEEFALVYENIKWTNDSFGNQPFSTYVDILPRLSAAHAPQSVINGWYNNTLIHDYDVTTMGALFNFPNNTRAKYCGILNLIGTPSASPNYIVDTIPNFNNNATINKKLTIINNTNVPVEFNSAGNFKISGGTIVLPIGDTIELKYNDFNNKWQFYKYL